MRYLIAVIALLFSVIAASWAQSVATVGATNVYASYKIPSFVHILAGSTVPTIVAGAGAGTGATVAIQGDDKAGYITITTAGLPTLSSTVATVTFGSPYSGTPHAVILTPANINALGLLTTNPGVWVDPTGISATQFVIQVNGNPLASPAVVYKYFYAVDG